eukprot:GILJ01003366.1.p1 GENE.GILJ01003366.1~~GILJ01003366.1.p1  ORF type:complete len:205 (+),score=23.04 GILJ01003366.1:58-615(+)
MTEITPEYCLALTGPTEEFLCPLDANTYGIDFVAFKIRDLDSSTTLFDIRKDPAVPAPQIVEDGDEDLSRTIRYHFGPLFLKLRNIGTTLEFSVGPQPVQNFRMIERHYFRGRLIQSYDFKFGFCMPDSTNSWEAIYTLPELSPEEEEDMINSPWETKSDSFYFVGNDLIMHNKALYSYAAFDEF